MRLWLMGIFFLKLRLPIPAHDSLLKLFDRVICIKNLTLRSIVYLATFICMRIQNTWR